MTEQLSIFSQEGYLANHLVKPGSKGAKKMTVTSGMRCLELYEKYDQLGLLSKMLLTSKTWGSQNFYLTWTIQPIGTKRMIYQLAESTPNTEDTDCLLSGGQND